MKTFGKIWDNFIHVEPFRLSDLLKKFVSYERALKTNLYEELIYFCFRMTIFQVKTRWLIINSFQILARYTIRTGILSIVCCRFSVMSISYNLGVFASFYGQFSRPFYGRECAERPKSVVSFRNSCFYFRKKRPLRNYKSYSHVNATKNPLIL